MSRRTTMATLETANSGEPTSGLEPLTCPLRVSRSTSEGAEALASLLGGFSNFNSLLPARSALSRSVGQQDTEVEFRLVCVLGAIPRSRPDLTSPRADLPCH